MNTDRTITYSQLFTEEEYGILFDFLNVEKTKCINMHGDVVDADKLATINKIKAKAAIFSV